VANAARIGHNNSPTDPELLRDYLAGIAGLLTEEAENLALESEALPTELHDHSESSDLTDFVGGCGVSCTLVVSVLY